jgi:hypothetical protein
MPFQFSFPPSLPSLPSVQIYSASLKCYFPKVCIHCKVSYPPVFVLFAFFVVKSVFLCVFALISVLPPLYPVAPAFAAYRFAPTVLFST